MSQPLPPEKMGRRVHGVTIVLALALAGGLAGLLWFLGVSNYRRLVANVVGVYLGLWGLVFLFSPRSRRMVAARFAMVSTALGLVVLCLEAPAFLGFVDYRLLFGVPVSPYWQGPALSYDPELLWVNVPHARRSHTSRGDLALMRCRPGPQYSHDVRYDAKGYRNAEELTAADVAVIGDSIVEGLFVPSELVSTSVLARLTQTRVANLGVSAYGPQQTLIVLKRHALPLRPRVIVWALWEGNDLRDTGAYDALRAAVDSGQLPVASSAIDRSFTQAASLALMRMFRGCRESSQVFTSGVFRTESGDDVEMHFYMLRRLRNDTWSAEHEQALRRIGDVLAEANEVTRSQGIPLVVLFIPISYRVYGDRLRCADDPPCGGWVLNDFPRRFAEVVATVADKTRYVDLTAAFRKEAKRGRVLYFPDDTHLSPDGHRVVAEVVAEAISEQLRDGRSGPRTGYR